jgi:competence protein ComEA
MNSRLSVLFSRSDARVVLLLVIALLIGTALTIHHKSREIMTPDIILKSLDAASADTRNARAENNDFLREMLLRNPININTAPADSLEMLPGIGPELSRRIVDYRRRISTYRTVEDLKMVRGIGDARLEDIRSMITVGKK